MKYKINKNLLKSSNGIYITNGLFYETQNRASENSIPIFTLKEDDITRDGTLLFSLKKIYLSYEHAPFYEYEFAMEIFGEWEHWERMCKASSIKEHTSQWRDELTIRLKAEAIKEMIAQSKGGGNSAAAAAKYISTLGWESKAGRPTNEDKIKQAKISAGVRDSLQADMERLGIKVVEK